jgi:hypothetical protein
MIFPLLQPCAYIAADYVLLGQLGRHLCADQFLVIPARRITIVFIMSDVTTFLIQVRSSWVKLIYHLINVSTLVRPPEDPSLPLQTISL